MDRAATGLSGFRCDWHVWLEVLGCWHVAGEGDGECVECRFPPGHPLRLFRVLGFRDRTIRGSSRWPVGAGRGPWRSWRAGIGCSGSRSYSLSTRPSGSRCCSPGTDERFPCFAPEFRDRRVGLAPFLFQFLERGPGGLGRVGGVDRAHVRGQRLPVLLGRVPETAPDHVDDTGLHDRLRERWCDRARWTLEGTQRWSFSRLLLWSPKWRWPP